MQNAAAKATAPTATGTNGANNQLQAVPQSATSLLERFLPHGGTQIMPETESKGIFLPYPLLGILLTLIIVLVTGIITLEVQVSNLSTTMLLRDADQRAQMKDVQDRLSTMQVYLQNDRERLVRIETRQDGKPKGN